jgi:hypothetical protein
VAAPALAVRARPSLHWLASRSRSRPGATRPLEHGRVSIDAGDVVPGQGERHGDAARAHGQLHDRPAGTGRQREIQIEVARILRESEVIEPSQGRVA